jgi:hypothetical protein
MIVGLYLWNKIKVDTVENLQLLKKKSIQLRSNLIDEGEFKDWVSSVSKDLSTEVSRGAMLKLKRGGKSEILEVSTLLFSACDQCLNLFPQGEFASRLEHSDCVKKVDAAISQGLLTRVDQPDWFKPSTNQIGSDAYYRCTSCGALWSLVEPERQYHGLWERIA